jgi:sugar lactone lactonase YvrE
VSIKRILIVIFILITLGLLALVVLNVFPQIIDNRQRVAVVNLSQKTEQAISENNILTGQGEPNSKVSIQILPNGGKATVKTNFSGKWEYSLPKNLEKKSYLLTVMTFDQNSNVKEIKTYRIKVGSLNPPLSNLVKSAHAQTIFNKVTKDNVTSHGNTNVSNLQFTHTIGNTAILRYLLVGVAIGKSRANATSVKYGDKPLTLIGATSDGRNQRVEIWGLANPSRGTANVSVNLSTRADLTVIATSFTGVNLSEPIDTYKGAAGFSSRAEVTSIPSDSNYHVVDLISVNGALITQDQAQQILIKRAFGQATGGMSEKEGEDLINMAWNLFETRNGTTPKEASWAMGAISLIPGAEGQTLTASDDRDRAAGLMMIGIYLAKDIATGQEIYVTREEYEREVCFYERCTDDPKYNEFLEGVANNQFQYILKLGYELRSRCYIPFEAIKSHFPDPITDPSSPEVLDIFDPAFAYQYYPAIFSEGMWTTQPNCIPPLDPNNPGPNEIKETISAAELENVKNTAANYAADALGPKDPYRNLYLATNGVLATSTIAQLHSLSQGIYSPSTNEETKQLLINSAFGIFDWSGLGLTAKSGIKISVFGAKALTNKTVLKIKQASNSYQTIRQSINNGTIVPVGTTEALANDIMQDLNPLSISRSNIITFRINKTEMNNVSKLSSSFGIHDPAAAPGESYNVFRGNQTISKINSLASDGTIPGQLDMEAESAMLENLRGTQRIPELEGKILTDINSDPENIVGVYIQTKGSSIREFSNLTPSVEARVNLLDSVVEITEKSARNLDITTLSSSGSLTFSKNRFLYSVSDNEFQFQPIGKTQLSNTQERQSQELAWVEALLMETPAQDGQPVIKATADTKDVGDFLKNEIRAGKTLKEALVSFRSSYRQTLRLIQTPVRTPSNSAALSFFNQVIKPAMDFGNLRIITQYGIDLVAPDIAARVNAVATARPWITGHMDSVLFNHITSQEGLIFVINDQYLNSLRYTFANGDELIGNGLDGFNVGDLVLIRESLFQSNRWKTILGHELTHTFHKTKDFKYGTSADANPQDKILTTIWELATDHTVGAGQSENYAFTNKEVASTLFNKVIGANPELDIDLKAFALTGRGFASGNGFAEKIQETTGKNIVDWFENTIQVNYRAVSYDESMSSYTREGGHKYPFIILPAAGILFSTTQNTTIYFPLDETSWVNDCATPTVMDSSGGNKHGKSCPIGTGPTGGASGKINKAGSFDGINDYIQVDNPGLPSGDFTYSAWIRLNTNNDETILMATNNAGGYKLQLYIDPQARLVVVTNENIRLTSTTTIPLERWVHVLVTRSGTSIKAYFDGIADPSTGSDGLSLLFPCPLLIGVSAGSGCNGTQGHHFNGKIDDFRIYNRALSEAEISSLYITAPVINPVSVTINGQTKTITEIQANPFNIRLPGTVGIAQSFPMPVLITFSDNSTKTLNWTFNYQPSGSPTSSPSSSSEYILVADAWNSPSIGVNMITSRIQKFDMNGNYVGPFGRGYGTGDGQFSGPNDITFDSAGNIYVTDVSNSRIQKFDANGDFISKFGSYGTGNGQFSGPGGLAFDSAGNIYVTDSGNNRVQKFKPDGTYESQFGRSGSRNGQFNGPTDIVLDNAGNIYVVDHENCRVQKFNNAGRYQSHIGGCTTGTPVANDGKLYKPEKIAIDGAGNLLISDVNRVMKFSSSGTYLSQIGELTNNIWGAGSGNGQFSGPMGIDIDNNGNIFVIDWGNYRVQKFGSNGNFISKFGSYGTGNGQFIYPVGIAISKAIPPVSTPTPVPSSQPSTSPNPSTAVGVNRYLYAVDNTINITQSGTPSRVQKFDLNGVFQNKFAEVGPGTGGPVYGLLDVATDPDGNVWATVEGFDAPAEYRTVRKYSPNGTPLLTIGPRTADPNDEPFAIDVDKNGIIYITSAGDGAAKAQNTAWVRKYTKDGQFISQFGSWGSGDGQFYSGDGIAVDDRNGDIYIADRQNRRVSKFDNNGNFIRKFGSFGFNPGQFANGPDHIAIDSQGTVYVTDAGQHKVSKFTPDGNFITWFGLYGIGPGQFIDVVGIDIDGSDNIWIGDYYNNRIQMYDKNFVFKKQFGGPGTANGQFTAVWGIALGI